MKNILDYKMKKKNKLFAILLALPIFLSTTVKAHCPLCTVGAGAAAAGAVYLGVSPAVVAIFIGAFAMSMAMWFSTWLKKKFLKKKYIPFQTPLIILAVFLSTVIPIIPMLPVIKGFNLFLAGSYGGILNRAYMFNLSWIMSLIGAIIVFVSPPLNRKIKDKRNGKGFPFQGIVLTLILLLIFGGVLQLLLLR